MRETTGDATMLAVGTSSPFAPTRWTVVLTAAEPESPAAREAFGSLYRDYWPPLYAFVRRRGHEPSAAEDITQDFFAALLEKQRLNGVTREGGKFRSFLLTSRLVKPHRNCKNRSIPFGMMLSPLTHL